LHGASAVNAFRHNGELIKVSINVSAVAKGAAMQGNGHDEKPEQAGWSVGHQADGIACRRPIAFCEAPMKKGEGPP
jgi:hypothetical protein